MGTLTVPSSLGVLTFEEEGHIYRVNGQRVPSVTTVLKISGLINDRFYTPAGRDRGTAVHQHLELVDLVDANEEDAPEGIRGYIKAYLKFLSESGFRVEDLELATAGRGSSGHLYAGTRDRSGWLKSTFWYGERRIIMDFKTGSPAGWHHEQLGGYIMADGQRAGGAVLYLRKSGTYRLDVLDAHQEQKALAGWDRALNEAYSRMEVLS